MNPTTLPPRHNPDSPLTAEQKQAICAVAGRRKDPSMDRLMNEVDKFRERLRQEEITRQDETERK